LPKPIPGAFWARMRLFKTILDDLLAELRGR
jgi:hypothetical protein